MTFVCFIVAKQTKHVNKVLKLKYMKEAIKIIISFLIVLIELCIFGVFISVPIMLLWNAVMPDIFGLPVINFWQALGLSVLSSFLIKGGSIKNDN